MAKFIAWISIMLFTAVTLSGQEIYTDSCTGLDVEEFYLQMGSSTFPLLLDARTWDEFRKERIEGSILAENREKLAEIADTIDRDQPVFIYCQEETRSITACKLLKEKGFTVTYYLKGGLSGWKQSGYKTNRNKIRKRRSQN